jgi:hypothetical protein
MLKTTYSVLARFALYMAIPILIVVILALLAQGTVSGH